MKKVDYSESIASCDLKQIDLSFIDEDLTCFSQIPLAHFQPKFECKLVGTS